MIKPNPAKRPILAILPLIALTLFYAVSTRAEGSLTTSQKMQYVVNFIVCHNELGTTPAVYSYVINAPKANDTGFLSELPSGYSYGDEQAGNPIGGNPANQALQTTCYLKDNVLYAIKALQPYTTQGTSYDGTKTFRAGSAASAAMVNFYEKYCPATDPTQGNVSIPEESLDYCAIGVDTGEINGVPNNDYYGVTQFVAPGEKYQLANGQWSAYTINTDYDTGSQSGGTPTAHALDFSGDGWGSKDLMKTGVLLEIIRYNHGDGTALARAKTDFEQVVANGVKAEVGTPKVFVGFPEQGNPTGQLDTRNLAYFILCEGALLSVGVNPSTLPGGDTNYNFGTICQNIIWNTCWEDVSLHYKNGFPTTPPTLGWPGTGGVWNAYQYSTSNGFSPASRAKMTNEDASLVLLAFEALPVAQGGTGSKPFLWTNPFGSYFNGQNSQFGD